MSYKGFDLEIGLKRVEFREKFKKILFFAQFVKTIFELINCYDGL